MARLKLIEIRSMIKMGNLINMDRLQFGEAFQKGWLRKFLQSNILQWLLKFNTNAKLSIYPGNFKGGSIIVLLTSCLTGFESAV
jgi:hypothetical protein